MYLSSVPYQLLTLASQHFYTVLITQIIYAFQIIRIEKNCDYCGYGHGLVETDPRETPDPAGSSTVTTVCAPCSATLQQCNSCWHDVLASRRFVHNDCQLSRYVQPQSPDDGC